MERRHAKRVWLHARRPAGGQSRLGARRIHPDDQERVAQGIHQAIDSGKESWSAEYRFQHQDGRYAYVLDRGSVIRDSSGRAIRMIGGMANLTTRKEPNWNSPASTARCTCAAPAMKP